MTVGVIAPFPSSSPLINLSQTIILLPPTHVQTRAGKSRFLGSFHDCISSGSLISPWAGWLLCRAGEVGWAALSSIYKTNTL